MPSLVQSSSAQNPLSQLAQSGTPSMPTSAPSQPRSWPGSAEHIDDKLGTASASSAIPNTASEMQTCFDQLYALLLLPPDNLFGPTVLGLKQLLAEGCSIGLKAYLHELDNPEVWGKIVKQVHAMCSILGPNIEPALPLDKRWQEWNQGQAHVGVEGETAAFTIMLGTKVSCLVAT